MKGLIKNKPSKVGRAVIRKNRGQKSQSGKVTVGQREILYKEDIMQVKGLIVK